MTDNYDYETVLNLPDTLTSAPPQTGALGTLQLDLPGFDNEEEPQAPRDQVVRTVVGFDQLALIAMVYYKSKYGIPMLTIIEDLPPENLSFHLENE